ncbi:hypothetical protein M758_1G072300 [Ceratodon purpureus]|uniref:Cytochrome b-c1 complex subunit 8 n=1 Tax=Ceratodon purpureus TaxID=3225 RepID=A0A8T0J2H3_CERPU|nr:hypothetical protein KC19_1G073900 [Ceratodon purpureus]KAG0629043.1 hypothetical protein M758_1G072300 [Ceratodon purpureus]
MGKVPVRLKEVTYSLSANHQYVWRGILHDFSYKTKKRFNDNWVSALWLLVPVFGSYGYAEAYREREKLHHRS